MTEFTPVYYEQGIERKAFASLQTRARYDLAIIGAGVAGISLAWECAALGIKACVLERDRLAAGASGRNGGFVFGGFSRSFASLEKLCGTDSAKELIQLSQQGVAIIRARLSELGLSPSQDDGVLLGDILGSGLDKLAAERARSGISDRLVRKEQIHTLAPGARYRAGLLEKDGFSIQPLSYLLAMADSVARRGVQIYEQSPVLHITECNDHVRVHTPNGSVRAERVALCVGGYADGLFPAVTSSVLPVWTAIGVLERRIDLKQPVYDNRFDFDYYRALGNGLLWGCGISPYPLRPHRVAASIRRRIGRIFPEYQPGSFSHLWGGRMSYASHRMPQVGVHKTRYAYAQAFGGHGLAPATIASHCLAKALAGNTDALRPWRRFDLRALPPGKRIGLEVTYRALRAADRLREVRAAM